MTIGSVNSMVPGGTGDFSSTPALSEDQRTLIRAVAAVNGSGTFGQDNELTYSVDRNAHIVVVKLVNKDTGNVVQQIPAEYLLRMAEELNRG
jgi:FlaG protein